MPSTAAANDAEDVNDFLKRIQELGIKRDQEDEERNRKLEEEILQGRKERQARRAERARSISPSKDSPTNTPPSHKVSADNSFALSTSRQLTPSQDPDLSNKLSARDIVLNNAMERITRDRSPTKENALLFTGHDRDDGDAGSTQQDAMRTSPLSAVPLSRTPTLSWQQRPSSRASDKPRSRPLSMIATENAARSPRSTPEPSNSTDGSTVMSRDQIAQSLASKDPTWFRQTSDRGGISAAYRKNQVEDANVAGSPSMSSRMQLPGMTRDPVKQNASLDTEVSSFDRSSSPSMNSSSNGSMATTSLSRTTMVSGSIGSPVPLKIAPKLPPPGSVLSSEGEEASAGTGLGLAMSPAQGRISPERLDRSPSPTKGMGGFVQSAMMKRSDSVSKRWSVQSPQSLSRGNSVASNRTNYDHATGIGQGGNPSVHEKRSSGLSRDNSPLPPSRAISSHNDTMIMQEGGHTETSGSAKSSVNTSTSNSALAKPDVPASSSQVFPTASKDNGIVTHLDDMQLRVNTTPPASPPKMNDTRRWSPTKASWLESALNKPESPKPKPTPPLQQPVWLSELNKAKQRSATDSLQALPTHKHEVNIGGLLRSPPMGGPEKPLSIGSLPASFSYGSTSNPQSSNEAPPQSSPDTNTPATNVTPSSAMKPPTQDSIHPSATKTDEIPSKLTDISAPGKSAKSSASGKIKPVTPPKKDFKVNLKPRQQPSDTDTKDEPEFKSMFGQLRRTKTQNYVAPDELKDNVLRGKAGLNTISGPQKTERKDEFKEAILKKKEDFKRAQSDGTSSSRTAPGTASKEAPIPEALARKATLGRPGTSRATVMLSNNERNPGPIEIPAHNRVTRDLPKPTLTQESSAPGRLQSYEPVGGNSADKFNAGLVGIFARGPPQTGSAASPISSAGPSVTSTSKVRSRNEVDSQDLGPQLTHMTKGRARGPRRKAPTTVATKTPVAEVLSNKDIPHSSISTFQTMERQAEVAPIIVKKTPVSNVPVQNEPENANPQPSSPRKLDIARRSKFLEEVQNKNDKTVQQLDIPIPSSPTKKANVPEMPMKMPEAESSTLSHHTPLPAKSKPTPMPKSPTLTQKQGTAQRIQLQGNDASQLLVKAKPTPLPKKVTSTESTIIPSKQPDGVNLSPELDAVLPVKSTAVLFSSKSSSTTETRAGRTTRKLPSRDDKEIPTVGAGVRFLGDNAKQAILASTQSPSHTIRNTAALNRPIPASTPKPSIPTPLSSGSKPESPKETKNRSISRGTETYDMLKDFFKPNDAVEAVHVDAATLISAKTNGGPKIKSLQSQLFELNSGGKKQAVPTHQERMLFEHNMYICPHTFTTSIGKKVTEVYFWIGDEVPESVSQDATIFAQSEAKNAGGRLVKIQQGKETAEFIVALGGIIIIRRGSSNRYDSLAPHILCGRRHAGQIAFDEVDFSPASLCSGFPFLIATESGKTYLWKGKGSDVDELSSARLIGTDIGLTGEIEEIEDGNEPASFLSVFDKKAQLMKSAEHWRMKLNCSQYGSRLFCADSASKSLKISEISPFSQADISPYRIYVLDAFFEIYVIVGARSQSQYPAFCTAVQFAQEYGIMAAGMEDRPFVPVSTVVLEGAPRDLKFVFRKWTDALMTAGLQATAKPALARGKSLRILPLAAALDATRI